MTSRVRSLIERLGPDRRSRGASAEQLAERWLIEQGLTLVTRNYHCRMGEIDLIMRHRACLVFVEVRWRSGSGFGSASASVTRNKQQRLIRAARHYLARHPQAADLDCRFDVVGMAPGAAGRPDFEWIQHAFYAE